MSPRLNHFNHARFCIAEGYGRQLSHSAVSFWVKRSPFVLMSLISGSSLLPWLIPDHGRRYNLLRFGNLPVRTGHTQSCLPPSSALLCGTHVRGGRCTQDGSGGTQHWPITRSPGDQDYKAHQPTHRNCILQYQLNQSLRWCSSLQLLYRTSYFSISS